MLELSVIVTSIPPSPLCHRKLDEMLKTVEVV